ncbi:ras-related protein Ral-B-like [Haliotis cracherodii]|uniref:ras-related protein Ral-B-like n=1 Tax=Haliotis cracherodii TaxID=6455 RepID=UPI0039E9EA98
MTTAERKSVLRVMVVGVAGVGKRAVVEDFIEMRADLGEKTTSFEHGHKWTIQDCEVTFHIVDVSPDTVSDKALKRQIRACDAFILMHLVEEKKSFEILPLIKDVILKEKGMETDLPVFVVGHRVDFKELVVESKIASTVVWDWMMNYRELFEGNQKHNSKLFGDIMERWFGTSLVANTQERKQKPKKSFFQRLFKNLKLR